MSSNATEDVEVRWSVHHDPRSRQNPQPTIDYRDTDARARPGRSPRHSRCGVFGHLCYDQLVFDPKGPIMKRQFHTIPMHCLLAVMSVTDSGCRAIRRFGESRQSIAARRLSGQGFQAMHDGQWEIAETLFTDA